MMRRVQVKLDERTYAALRRRARDRHESISATVRELLREGLRASEHARTPGRKKRLTLKDFPWIGAFSSSDPFAVSEEHDRVLGESEW